MKVAEWIRRRPGAVVTVAPSASLEEVVDRLLSEPNLRDVYVVDPAGRLIGHLSHRRLAHLLLAEHRPAHSRRQMIERVAAGSAGELMETHFAVAAPEEELDNVLSRQLEHGVEDMPVIDRDGILLGAVNITAILRAFRDGTLNGDGRMG